MRRQGGEEARRQGGEEVRRQGGKEVRRQGGKEQTFVEGGIKPATRVTESPVAALR